MTFKGMSSPTASPSGHTARKNAARKNALLFDTDLVDESLFIYLPLG